MGAAGYAAVFVAVLAAVIGATGAAVRLLRARAILDHPNERSSHSFPTPRGGGIAVMTVLILAWAAVAAFASDQPGGMLTLAACAVALAAVSWMDDLQGLPVWVRLGMHLAVAMIASPMLPQGGLVFQGLLPLYADRIAAILLWVWFINLFNFMDGIDGIAGTETIGIGAGLFLIAILSPQGMAIPGFALYALTLTAAGLGFLCWNWAPAKIFLGDVGSVPLGFMIGFLLLAAAARGLWAAALILPLYYMADSGLTLLRRLLNRERVWQAHASHFYQQAARRFGAHAPVVRAIAVADAVLVGLALLAAAAHPWPALAGAVAVVAGLLFYLAGGKLPGGFWSGRRGGHDPAAG